MRNFLTEHFCSNRTGKNQSLFLNLYKEEVCPTGTKVEIKHSDANRLARKIEKLLEKGDLLEQLFNNSAIKDEYRHLSKICNKTLERYVDQAIE